MRRFNSFFNVVDLSSWAIDRFVETGQTVVDATLGNGNDALQMAKRIGEAGTVYGFDIQELAIENSKRLFEGNDIRTDYHFILDSHSKLNEYVHGEIDFGIMNLGYLPGSDKSVVTIGETSVNCIEKLLDCLKPGGVLVISSYSGHDGGAEQNTVVEYLRRLNQRAYNVISMDFINQANSPAVFYMIEKSII